MKRALLLFALSISIPTITSATDYGKLVDSVDKQKAADSVDMDKAKEAWAN